MNRSLARLLLLLAALAPAPATLAQSGGNLSMTWHSHQGGAARLAGGAFELSGTAGTHDGTSGLAGGLVEHDGGFAPGVCGSRIVSYGAGCPGTGGFVPVLTISGCAAPGDVEVFSVSGGLGGSTAFLMLGLGQAAVPIGAGCLLNIAAPFPGLVGPLPLSGAGGGTGAISFALTVPNDLVFALGYSATHQVLVLDPASPLQFVATNGVEVTLG